MSEAPPPVNRHATALALAGHGVLIEGPSGAGKTSLALALLLHARAAGLEATLVADDQVLLSVAGGRLMAEVPTAIAGLVEVRGAGPVRIAHRPTSPVDLVVRLVELAERFPEPREADLLGIQVPLVELAQGDRQLAVFAVLARLGLPPFLPR